MSLLNVFTVQSFHRYNPDWQIIVYRTFQKCGPNKFTPDYTGPDMWHMIEELDYVRIKEIDLLNYGVPLSLHSCQASDLFRRNILYQQGGVYSDFDTLWLRPIDHIRSVEHLGNPDDFEGIVSFHEFTKGFHNVSNLISEPGSLYLWNLIQIQRVLQPPYDHQSFGSDMLNKAYPDWNEVASKHPRMLALKYETFYPYSTYCMEKLFVENDLSPLNNGNVLGIHWFFGNSATKHYLNKQLFSYSCSMNSILKLEGWM